MEGQVGSRVESQVGSRVEPHFCDLGEEAAAGEHSREVAWQGWGPGGCQRSNWVSAGSHTGRRAAGSLGPTSVTARHELESKVNVLGRLEAEIAAHEEGAIVPLEDGVLDVDGGLRLELTDQILSDRLEKRRRG